MPRLFVKLTQVGSIRVASGWTAPAHWPRSSWLELLLKRWPCSFAARVGAPYASAVSSGTAGLHLALRAVGVDEGYEVITTPFSFVASANVAMFERATPVFADIDPITLNLDPDAARAAVGDRTAAVLPVHTDGRHVEGDECSYRLPTVFTACRAG